jgi:multiple sugar transport system permease protein
MKTQNKERLFLLCFLVIPVLLLILFSYYPLIKLFQLSVSEWNGMSSTVRYIGLQNFKEIFSQKELFSVFINNGAYIIVALIQQFVGLFLAILLDSNLKVKKSFRAIIFMPYIINAVAIAFIFNYMYDFTNSPINVLLTNLGLKDYLVRFLGTNYSSNFWLAFISFWRYVGYTMVVYLAALQSVPREIFEAARVDGANFYQIIRKITLPNIKTMFQISLIMSINGALQAYFEPFLLTKGGPNGRTDTFITKTLSLAFDFNKFGKAAAMGVILLLIILIIVKIQKTIFKEKQNLS